MIRKSNIFIVALMLCAQTAYSNCNNIFQVTTDASDVRDIDDLDHIGSTGTAHLLLSSDNILDKPVILVEGIDFYNSIGCAFIENFIESQQPIISSLRAEGKDVVIVNFDDATKSIESNGILLGKIIKEINLRKQGRHSNAIIGLSMGGLVARYALTYMEYWNEAHETLLFISYDSPQKFANIPRGIHSILQLSPTGSAGDILLENFFGPIASKQMLSTRPFYTGSDVVDSDGDGVVESHVDLIDYNANLLSSLETLGNYPRLLRKVAFSNGSAMGAQGAYDFEPGDALFHINGAGFGRVNAVNDLSYSQSLICKEAWPELQQDMIDYPSITPESLVPAECAVGSYFSEYLGEDPAIEHYSFDNAPGSYSNILNTAFAQLPSVMTVTIFQGQTSFIPTISSLDIDTINLFYDIEGDSDIKGKTPFDEIYYPSNGENEEHLAISDEKYSQLLSELALYHILLDGDEDDDGLSNEIEISLGTGVYNADSDGDLLSDGFEHASGLNPLSENEIDGYNDRENDNDNDTFSNYSEFCGVTEANLLASDITDCNASYRSDPNNSLSTPVGQRAAIMVATIFSLLL